MVPELVQPHLVLPTDSAPSATGGHATFRGTSYSLQAIAAVTRRLRDDVEAPAVHANGGYLTNEHVTVLGHDPHSDGYVGGPTHGEGPTDGASLVRNAAETVAADGWSHRDDA